MDVIKILSFELENHPEVSLCSLFCTVQSVVLSYYSLGQACLC